MSTERNTSALRGHREQRARALAALGDPTRLGIMDLLAVQDLSPDALAASLEVPGNLLAHHVKVLQAAGLITRVHSQNDKRRTYLQATEGALTGLLPAVDELSAPRVLFVCTHNSARSVLAEALWRQASDVPSESAGTHPSEHVNPHARKIARKLGLSVAAHAPQSIEDVLRDDDIVVSVCDSVNEELDHMANLRIHWSIPDPAAVGTDAAFITAVEELRHRIDHLAPRVTYRRSHHKRRARR